MSKLKLLRTGVQDLIAALGGTPSGWVFESMHLPGAGPKQRKAQSLGVRVLTRTEWTEKYLEQ